MNRVLKLNPAFLSSDDADLLTPPVHGVPKPTHQPRERGIPKAKQPQDRRTQFRAEVRTPAQIFLPNLEQPLAGINCDLSWGGARLVLAEALPEDASLVKLVLPWTAGQAITADAHILRVNWDANGRQQVAVRFSSLSPRSQSRLVKLLDIMAREHPQGRPTLVEEIEISVNTAEELYRMLTQIAVGRQRLTVFDAGYSVGQSLGLAITGTTDLPESRWLGAHGLPEIRLRARVGRIDPLHMMGHEWARLAELTLLLEHPRETLERHAAKLIGRLVDARTALLGRAVHQAPRRARRRYGDPMQSVDEMATHDTLSPFEQGLPDIIQRLTQVWGDIDAFEALFKDLLLGQAGPAHGWRKETWSDLLLLDQVHRSRFTRDSATPAPAPLTSMPAAS